MASRARRFASGGAAKANATIDLDSRRDASRPGIVFLSGVTGYVGGRLARRLQEHGHRVRCGARNPEYITARFGSAVEAVRADAFDVDSLRRALKDCRIAYYLIHSMAGGEGFAEREAECARNFAQAAKDCGVERIIFLGGLGDGRRELSLHLWSRQNVGSVLASTGLTVVELRASIIIGSGSLSFEMVRALVERLPVMITPRWVSVQAQPIAIDDVLAYLEQSIDVTVPRSEHTIFEIGGADRLAYGDLMREYARRRGLKRLLIRVPVLSPRLSSLWLGLVTPLYASVGRFLIESIRHPSVVNDRVADRHFALTPRSVSESIDAALRNEDREFAETRWSDSVSQSVAQRDWGGVRLGNRLVDSRSIKVKASAQGAFTPIQRIGGTTGWYYAQWLWTLRGWLDLLFGGVGMRRGRRHPEHLATGDVVDCWRVERIVPGQLLRLQAEMKLPGRAWLEFEVTQDGDSALIRQTAIFDPKGLLGLMYWYGVYPLHELVFRNMLHGIARRALRERSS
jgi:uncharacterized protein YbjT (DUF2867 family)